MASIIPIMERVRSRWYNSRAGGRAVSLHVVDAKLLKIKSLREPGNIPASFFVYDEKSLILVASK